MRSGVSVRTATPNDRLDVHRLVDGAMLEVPDLDARLEAGDVLVADAEGHERPLGTLVCEPVEGGWEVVAVVVRRPCRDRGIGTTLVEAAGEREGRLVAEFDADVRPFYESLGFSTRENGGGGDGSEDQGRERYRGERSG